ncbi:MAG TPA: hypothetical protein DIW81_26665 [Planctomycetaceae bacterium]|nr:hypothetical protein [Planctomycetaceae bacterium]
MLTDCLFEVKPLPNCSGKIELSADKRYDAHQFLLHYSMTDESMIDNSSAQNSSEENLALSPPLEPRRRSRKEFYSIWGSSIAVTIVGFTIAWLFVEPAPGNHLKIAAGPSDGNYYATAKKYADVFQEAGIHLEIIETAGTIENYRLLQDVNDINLAIVQGGAVPKTLEKTSLEAIASLNFEPLWIFLQAESEITEIRELKGKRISIGLPDSGTETLMLRLLEINGLIAPVEESDASIDSTPEETIELFRESTATAIAKLRAGERDAVCMVRSASNPVIRQLFETPELSAMPFPLNKTYRLLFPALSDIQLQEGILDLKNHQPAQNLKLIAPAANLVCTPELHDAFVPLLLKAATLTSNEGNLIVPSREFPSLGYIEFEPHAGAVDYFQSGESFLYRYLPFWLASFLNRMKIMAVPLLTLAIPLFKMAPPAYRWRIRSRIYRWYRLLREIDQENLRDQTTVNQQRYLEKLDRIACELSEVDVPLSYMEEFYNLHLHIDLIRRRVLGVTDLSQNSGTNS